MIAAAEMIVSQIGAAKYEYRTVRARVDVSAALQANQQEDSGAAHSMAGRLCSLQGGNGRRPVEWWGLGLSGAAPT